MGMSMMFLGSIQCVRIDKNALSVKKTDFPIQSH